MVKSYLIDGKSIFQPPIPGDSTERDFTFRDFTFSRVDHFIVHGLWFDLKNTDVKIMGTRRDDVRSFVAFIADGKCTSNNV